MKQHELLAIEGNLETQAIKCRTDLANTFEKKRHLFEEKRTVFTPNTEGALQQVESQSDIQSTVESELAWIRQHLSKSWDASYQVAETNTTARADIILEDGTTIATQVPATYLLELQKRMAELLSLIQAAPTLDPAKGFQADPQRGIGIYKAREVRKTRTQKQMKVLVKYEATEKHPAQTEAYTADVPIGVLDEQEWSAMLTPARKAGLLNRVEILTRAVRQARSRANEAEVDTSKKIADQLLGYILD